MLALQSINQNIIFNEDDYFETKNNYIKISNIGEAGKDEFDETFGLLERKRNQKLSTKQIELLGSKINESTLTSKQLSNQFGVFLSLINKIKHNDLFYLWRGRSNNPIKIFGKEKDLLINALKNFIDDADHAYNSIEITNYVNRILNKSYKPNYIRNLLKIELNMSFKRVKPRPNTINLEVLKASRQLFAIKFTQLISKETLLINIDETSFNRHIKNNYSWSYKGIPFEAKNIPFVGSINCIMSIWSNGSWLWLLTNQTSNSSKFELFLNHLYNWITTNKKFKMKEISIILDNWSIHKSQHVIQKFWQMKWKVIYRQHTHLNLLLLRCDFPESKEY